MRMSPQTHKAHWNSLSFIISETISKDDTYHFLEIQSKYNKKQSRSHDAVAIKHLLVLAT